MKISAISILIILVLTAYQAQNTLQTIDTSDWPKAVKKYYEKHKGDNQKSVSKGTTGNGTLQHGKLMPFKGSNYFYFSEVSYLKGRAFTTDKVQKATLNTYASLEKLYPGRQFGIMECSHKEGGKLWPHYTHQNGQSIDFMSPLQKSGSPYYGLDHKGLSHYWMEFDDDGRYAKDKSVEIDFNLMAHHILVLDKMARKQGIKITKVILKIELKDDLFAMRYGKQLKKSGIYFAQRLTPLVNKEHDDHYHVDFGPV